MSHLRSLLASTSQQLDPDFIDQAAQTFWLVAIIMAAFFAFLVVATLVRRSSRSQFNTAHRSWQEEDLFDPDDVAELALRLELTEAATRANINKLTVDRLFELANARADVVLVRTEPIVEQNGGRRQLLTVVFADATTFKLVTDSEVDTAALNPAHGLHLDSLSLSQSGLLVLVFKTRKAFIAAEVLEASSLPS